MISSVPIHNSFNNEMIWRSHFPVKQESLDDTSSQPNISTNVFSEQTQNLIDNPLQHPFQRPLQDSQSRFLPPTISTSPTLSSPHYLNYQKDLSPQYFKSQSPNSRISPYPSKLSPKNLSRISPNSLLTSPNYNQKILQNPSDIFRASTPESFRISPNRPNPDMYRSSPNAIQDFQYPFNMATNPMLVSHLEMLRSSTMPPYMIPKDYQKRIISPRHSPICPDENNHSPNISSNSKVLSPMSPTVSHNESNCSIESRSPSTSPIQNLKMVLKKTSADSYWNASAVTNDEPNTPEQRIEYNDVPSLKCYFCSYNTKSRIQLNKHMRDAHKDDKLINLKETKEDELNSDDEDIQSNLSEDCLMDEYEDDDGDEDMVNINKINPNANNNKRNSFKCKKCILIFKNKNDYYIHQREKHIKKEKLLECKLCPFVTEYKHHHEYHIKNHFKVKPFKCTYGNCKYSCNNQSMLNSHIKSHKSFYQFNCKNCNYATKYMHSFKLHLRKNNHEKGVTLNEDGSINNDIIIDIHGTRRGPKRKIRKLDDATIQNINNNNCITETIKKTIHQETACSDVEYNNTSLNSNNMSSRSNSPINNNNNNDNYYLNTKLFVYPQNNITSGYTNTQNIEPITNKYDNNVPDSIWKDNNDLLDDVEEIEDEPEDLSVPLDLTKTVSTMNDISNTEINKETSKNPDEILKTQYQDTNEQTNLGSDFTQIQKETTEQTDQKLSQFNFEQNSESNMKACDDESIQIKSPNLKSSQLIKIENKMKSSDNMIKIRSKINDLKNDEMKKHKDNDISEVQPKKMKMEEIISLGVKIHEPKISCEHKEYVDNNKQQNKQRRRKGKAYKLQISQDSIEDDDDEYSMNSMASERTKQILNEHIISNQKVQLENKVEDLKEHTETKEELAKDLSKKDEFYEFHHEIEEKRELSHLTKEYSEQIKDNYKELPEGLVPNHNEFTNYFQIQYLKKLHELNHPSINHLKQLTNQIYPFKTTNSLDDLIKSNNNQIKKLENLNNSLNNNNNNKTIKEICDLNKCQNEFSYINHYPEHIRNLGLENIQMLNENIKNVQENGVYNSKKTNNAFFTDSCNKMHVKLDNECKYKTHFNNENKTKLTNTNLENTFSQNNLKSNINNKIINNLNMDNVNLSHEITSNKNEIKNNSSQYIKDNNWYRCNLCDIQYLDEIIYSIHMRYHDLEQPFKCNLCGVQTNNKFIFNLHIIQTPH